MSPVISQVTESVKAGTVGKEDKEAAFQEAGNLLSHIYTI